MKEKICIVGAGPAGIIAAGIAGSRGKDVTLIEKNERIGKKLFITGKGRCNITNNAPIEDFFDNVMKNRNFLYSSFYSFTNRDIVNLLESYGLKTKVERGNRVFPLSDKSSDVIKAFQKFLAANNVKLLLDTKVNSIDIKNQKFIVRTNKDETIFDKLVIATGGKSYPATGSTGDGYIFAEGLGHSITKIRPSLVPVEVRENWIKDLQGLSLKNITLSAYAKKKNIYEEFGEMIFTHYGISGPIVLSMSNHLYRYINDGIRLSIDLKPALDNKKLDDRILRDFELNNNKKMKNALDDLLPQKLIPIILFLSDLDPEKIINQITKEERLKLLNSIKEFPLTFKSFRPIEEAIITSGGVSTKEINPSTMESKQVSGLYFAGEVIDVDALTGGYNLQIAYSTGYLAGSNV
ncbi:NAD(P)/FAD-dependent oxidoreductase [Tissierella carlieri]|jgi:predicted Rossmann fold flavoprotein|uniref:NAD(P)/FAD-dependent oxidoreductase n=1 Tax=Tissierella TaxID=41273 RepID=UPI002804B165|nr:NAD(P)/FAD-dependent oxidoreductase [uncultured Tissierella sp.]MDU5079983.1 NAD(P)/FAD-dependent oxidoreductase [Bacillota bacterium]